MQKQLGVLALECFFDLGITLVFAVIAGFLIVGIVATDDAPVSFISASLYAAALPGAAFALIIVEILLRMHKELRETRRRPMFRSVSVGPHRAVRASFGPTRSR